jgi:hypothetical protein
MSVGLFWLVLSGLTDQRNQAGRESFGPRFAALLPAEAALRRRSRVLCPRWIGQR